MVICDWGSDILARVIQAAAITQRGWLGGNIADFPPGYNEGTWPRGFYRHISYIPLFSSDELEIARLTLPCSPLPKQNSYPQRKGGGWGEVD